MKKERDREREGLENVNQHFHLLFGGVRSAFSNHFPNLSVGHSAIALPDEPRLNLIYGCVFSFLHKLLH